jgi:hypothetical protein
MGEEDGTIVKAAAASFRLYGIGGFCISHGLHARTYPLGCAVTLHIKASSTRLVMIRGYGPSHEVIVHPLDFPFYPNPRETTSHNS